MVEQIRSFLATESKPALVAFLLERIQWDDALREALAVRAAAEAVKAGGDVTKLAQTLDAAFDAEEVLSRRDVRTYTNRVESAVDVIEEVLVAGDAAAAIALTEHALTKTEEAFESVDDSDGGLGDVRDRLQALHLRACTVERPDPVVLARRLFAREVGSHYDVFYGAVETYADVLGPEGVAEYRRLAEERWKKVSTLGPGQTGPDQYGARFRITSIMKALARVDGDVEAEAAVLARDLSHAYHFLKLAELYRDDEKPEQALAWAERGLKAFPERTDPRLRALVADAYHRVGRHSEAMAIAWAAFSERPDASQYKLLMEHAERANARPAWRKKALSAIRDGIAARQREAATSKWGRGPDHSTLVEVHLGEGDADAAWAEAKAGGCSRTLWMALAREREARAPEDALPIYQREVDALVREANNDAYARAVALMNVIRKVMARMDPEPSFTHYVDEVRRAHGAKRNLVRLLEGLASAGK